MHLPGGATLRNSGAITGFLGYVGAPLISDGQLFRTLLSQNPSHLILSGGTRVASTSRTGAYCRTFHGGVRKRLGRRDLYSNLGPGGGLAVYWLPWAPGFLVPLTLRGVGFFT